VDGLPNLVASDPRWVGSGRTVFDNKGNPVKQYEPYFSSTDAFEDEAELREQGVTVVLHYDPLGRLVRTDFPDGTYARVEFTPWEQTAWDRNDTAGETTWHSERMALSAGDPDRRAAEVTIPHHDTPTVTHFDPLGRPVRVIAVDGFGQTVATRSILDVEGNVLEVIDGRDNTAEARTYGMLGQALRTTSEDAGERGWAVGRPPTPSASATA
jgi:YD repeat-containing protein